MSDKRVCTLMYHDVYDVSNKESGINIESNYQYKIKKDAFEAQIKAMSEYLEDHGVNKEYIRLSFDDGGVSFYKVIMPIIEKYGFKGYFFIATSFIGQDGFLTEQMIKEMRARGHYIGGHSHSHRQMMHTLSYEELLGDWRKCLCTLEGIIGKPTELVSLPNGFESNTILKVLHSLGIKDVYTSEPSERIKQKYEMNILGRYGIRDSMKLTEVLDIVFNKKTKFKIKAKKKFLNILKKVMGGSYVSLREKIFKFKNS